MRIMPWQPGDEAAIVELFATVFKRPMSLDFWRWRYADHPAGGPLVSLAWDGDRLVSHYAASHGPLRVHGVSTPAALSMTTMTHPDYRGQGLFERTAEALYDRLDQMGMVAVWGFPNATINAVRRTKVVWHAVADIPALSRTLREGETFAAGAVTEVDRIDARMDTVAPPDVAISADHSHRILSWRIDRNPVNRYFRLVLPSGGDGLDGYAILKSYRETEFDLVSLAANDSEAYPDLIAGCLAKVQSLGGTRLSCWALPQDNARIALERAGFAATAPVTYLGGRALRPMSVEFDDVRNWRISMIDSDVY